MPKVSFRMASASRESVFGAQTSTARKNHRVGEGLPPGLRRSCPGSIAQRDAIHRTTTWCITMTYWGELRQRDS